VATQGLEVEVEVEVEVEFKAAKWGPHTPTSKLQFDVPHRQATTGQDVAFQQECQRFLTVGDFTADQAHAAGAAVAFPALVFHLHFVMLEHFQQVFVAGQTGQPLTVG